MIVLENLGRSFNGKWAVKGLNIEVEDGEVFGLLGPNGAGKTTVMKMLSGLLVPNEGRITIGGFDVSGEALDAKSITGYVPDRAFLYDKLTAREFLLFTASLYGLSKQNAIRRVSGLIEGFEITEIGDSLIESCSQGMRQRLLFASALLHEPKALLIDEPFVGLDPFGVLLVKKTIRELSEKGVSVFFATHSLHIAAELCHRVGLLFRGELISVKRKAEIEGGDLETLFIRTIKERHGG